MNRRPLDNAKGNLVTQLVYFDEFSDELGKITEPAEKHRISSLVDIYRSRLTEILGGNLDKHLQSEVLIGSTVTIRHQDGLEEQYRIVLPNESDIDQGCISFMSPLGRKLLMNRIGDTVLVESPAGCYQVQIMGISR